MAYVHSVGPATDLKGTAVEALAERYFQHFRQIYSGTLIANLGFTQEMRIAYSPMGMQISYLLVCLLLLTLTWLSVLTSRTNRNGKGQS